MAKKETEILILSVAQTLFFKYGIKRVSIEELCREVGISRKTFYTYYKNKEELLIGLIDWMVDPVMEEFKIVMMEDSSFEIRLLKLLKNKMEAGREMNMQFLKDLYGLSGRFPDYLNAKIAEGNVLFEQFLRTAQENGEVRQDLRLDFLMLMMSLPGELIRSGRFDSIFSNRETMLRQVMNLYLYGILSDKCMEY